MTSSDVQQKQWWRERGGGGPPYVQGLLAPYVQGLTPPPLSNPGVDICISIHCLVRPLPVRWRCTSCKLFLLEPNLHSPDVGF